MPPRPRAHCQICSRNEYKYTCSSCRIIYCSVSCYKHHKDSCRLERSERSRGTDSSILPVQEEVEQSSPLSQETQSFAEAMKLRPLTSLKWPYIPEGSTYPDPLKRDDPKALQMHQYEAIATSSAIREALATYPRLPTLLKSIDELRGTDREQALQRALGMTVPDIMAQASVSDGGLTLSQHDEDVLALRALAEAVEIAVRGNKEDALGVDWGE